MQPRRAQTSGLGVPPLLLARLVGSVAPVRPTHGVWFVVARLSAALGAYVCAVYWATWLLFTGVPVRCVVLPVRCPRLLGSCAPVCSRGAWCCACGVLGQLAPVHRCARSARCVACAVSWATWLLLTGVLGRWDVWRVRCPWPVGSCSPVCLLAALCCVCGVLGHLAPVHRCASSVRCVVYAVSWVTWPLCTCVPAPCVVLRVWCPGPLGPVHRCARSVRCVESAASCATWLLFTSVLVWCVVLRVRFGPLGSCSPVCSPAVLCCVCGALPELAPVHRCARTVRCVACAVSWASCLPFSGVLARCIVLCVQCPGPLGSCSPVCPLLVLCCVRSVLGHLAPVHRCARSVCCVACAVFWATWLLFTGVFARCAV